MDLLVITESTCFNEQEIHERDLIRARYHTWDEARNGIVIGVSGQTLTVIFMPKVHRATTYFTIKADEVKDGKWELTYTEDFTHIGRVEMTYGDSGSSDSETPDGESANSDVDDEL